MLSTSPRLWIIATPIGNTGDLSPRAKKILQNADIVLAEDTRRASCLFKEAGIRVKTLLSFFEHNEEKRQAQILTALKNGAQAAIISDAGTPLLSDPGYRLVCACRKEHIPVSPVPGPSAPIAAICSCGLPPLPFSFLGFLPRALSRKAELFQKFSSTGGSIVFFERKDRLCESLQTAFEILGNREFVICREMTQEHEEFIAAKLEDYETHCRNLLGEITVVIGPEAESVKTSEQEILNMAANMQNLNLKPRDIARQLAKNCAGWSTADIYELLISRK